MNSFHNILLCYDATLEGRIALRHGAELAEKLGAKAHLLAISPDVGSSMCEPPSQMVLLQEEKGAREVLREGLEQLRRRGLDVTGHLAFGRPIEQIAIAARNLGVDLIVIGYKPTGKMARWWVGRGNAALIDAVGCSVFVSIYQPESASNKM